MSEMCGCDYCIEGPFYESGTVVHLCDECREEYLDDGFGCVSCAAYESALEQIKQRKWGGLN